MTHNLAALLDATRRVLNNAYHGPFSDVRALLTAVEDEDKAVITVTPDTGADAVMNEWCSGMAKSLQQDIDKLGLKTKAQVEYLCLVTLGQRGKIVGHGGSHVWVSWPGRSGARILIVTSTNPNW